VSDIGNRWALCYAPAAASLTAAKSWRLGRMPISLVLSPHRALWMEETY